MRELSGRNRIAAKLVLFLILSVAALPAQDPINQSGRLQWALRSTVGPQSLAAGVLSAGWGTAFDSPEEYDTNFKGFGKRYGLWLSTNATSNLLEAELGALRGEDPRYFRLGEAPPKNRVWHAVKWSVLAKDRNGRATPAYARWAAMGGSRFLSNTWRPDSQSTVKGALVRTSYGFLGRIASNAFAEFWPDLRKLVFRR